uniref:Si:dkey-43k4.3 n=1 Tax=Astyanax mexicanus TaxID=7994 RepID=A0A3B1K2K8_ASTMX
MDGGSAAESSSSGGLWNCPRVKYSNDTRELLQLMMRESRLTSFQQRQLNNQLKRDLEKEKRRLQNIFATGQEEPQLSVPQTQPPKRAEETHTDRFQEVLDEIEERRQFLEEMTALGRGRDYNHIINFEISQKIKELELIDMKRSEELKTLMK